MKANSNKIQYGRIYELTGVREGGAWSAPFRSPDCILGTIVTPLLHERGVFRILSSGPCRKLHINQMFLGGSNELRPLSHKDQKRIEDANSNVSG